MDIDKKKTVKDSQQEREREMDRISTDVAKKILQMTDQKSSKKGRFSFLRINPLILITTIILLFFFSYQLFSRDMGQTRINLNDLIVGIKGNQFSQLVIENGGNVQAIDKTHLIFNINNDSVDPSQFNKNTLEFNDSFETIELNDLISNLKSGNDLISQLRSLLNRNAQITEIILADNYLIATRVAPQKDFLIRDVTPEQFYTKLRDNNLTASNFSVPVRKLDIYAASTTVDSLTDRINSRQISQIILLETGDIIAKIRPEYITRYYLDWTPIISTFTDLLQQEQIDLASTNIDIIPSNIPSGLSLNDVLTILTLVGFVILGIVLFRGMQGSGMGIMQFGQSKARVFFGSKTDTTFKDVAGIDEARDELNEIVDFLKNPNKFRKLGARIPKGVLMVGAPGTGKTLLARAIAGEAGVPFFHTSGSEFEEMLVGAGASRVRDLFAKAKKAAPALIFIDEIDAVARKRGTRIQSGTTEQTLNQILVEMDGFEKNTNVIVLAATNRPDVLDPAILRPGRFDRQLRIELPDMEGRKQILTVHGQNKPFDESVNLEKIAKRTVGFTGADLENILNEAAIIAAKENKKKISMDDIEEAVSKVVLGPAKKSRKRTDKEVQLVAYHEAGHAVVAKYTPEATPVDKISIISRGNTGGVTMFLPEKDEYITSRRKLLADITVSLGGRAAEEIALDDISTGASNDIEKATMVAKRMIQRFGMSEKLGLVRYGDFEDNEYLGYGYTESKDFSEKTAEAIDLEVRQIIQDAYARAKQILIDNRDKLDAVTNALLDKEVMGKEEFEAFF
jgi:cell division protease FtsH